MPLDSVPWAIGGGAQLQPEVLRAMAWQATGGGQGVGSRLDCKVLPLVTPGTKVRVSPGTVVMPNAFPGVSQGQSYMAQWLAEEQVNITATTGSARSDLVVARIADPQYDGSTPTSVADGPYKFVSVITAVANTTVSVDGLNLPYPAEALARIDIPPSTATITAGMIVDVRRLAQPRRQRVLAEGAPSVVYPAAAAYVPDTATALAIWPGVTFPTFVPKWATKAVVTMSLCNYAAQNNSTGYLWIQLLAGSPQRSLVGNYTQWDANNSTYSWDWANLTTICSTTIAIDSDVAGTTGAFRVVATGSGGASVPPRGGIWARPGMTVVLDCEYQETI